MPETIAESPKFRVGTKVWRVVGSPGKVACRACGGGGQLYDDASDTREPCGACRAAGTVETVRWHADPTARRATTCLRRAGAGFHYLVEGVEGPIDEVDLFDSWGKATEEASRRTEGGER